MIPTCGAEKLLQLRPQVGNKTEKETEVLVFRLGVTRHEVCIDPLEISLCSRAIRISGCSREKLEWITSAAKDPIPEVRFAVITPDELM
ncbi:MAG: hypothetical protein P4K83_05865 [Terracidiphilus sp.]|nr:hypothetical protein [Terracidiphilus sp.]